MTGGRRTAAFRALALGVLGSALLVGGPGNLAAQDDVLQLASACAGPDPTLVSPCLEAVLAVQAAQGLVGLGAGGATALPGSSSTLGKRFDGRPRFGFSVRGGFSDAAVPGELAPASGPAKDENAFAPSLQATVGVGLFQGFSTAPTVGGILAVDLLGTFSYVNLPGDRGFRDSSTGLGLGARIGVVRESFTLPGITFSATRRWMGNVGLDDGIEGGSRADVDVTSTSLRGTVGKTLAAVDALVGVGWDHYGGSFSLVVRPEGPGGPDGGTGADSFSSDRFLVYGGIGYTFLVYQLSLEGGWAGGFDHVPDRSAGGYDPTAGAPFLRVGFRLTY